LRSWHDLASNSNYSRSFASQFFNGGRQELTRQVAMQQENIEHIASELNAEMDVPTFS
jgi:hypothetical protein